MVGATVELRLGLGPGLELKERRRRRLGNVRDRRNSIVVLGGGAVRLDLTWLGLA